MACGLPCITTPVGGNPDAVNSNEVGILSDANVESMAEAIAAGLSRQWNTLRISEHGRRRTWQTVAIECRDHLAAVLESTSHLQKIKILGSRIKIE